MTIPSDADVTSKHYSIECFGGGECLGAPALAEFEIDRETAEFIVRMADFVRSERICKIETYDLRVTWYEDDPADAKLEGKKPNEMLAAGGRLAVKEDRFRFLTYRKYYNDEIETVAA